MISQKTPKIPVEEALVRELECRYTEYRSAVSAPFDPVAVLKLNGQVLATVRRILASLEHPGSPLHDYPEDPGN